MTIEQKNHVQQPLSKLFACVCDQRMNLKGPRVFDATCLGCVGAGIETKTHSHC